MVALGSCNRFRHQRERMAATDQEPYAAKPMAFSSTIFARRVSNILGLPGEVLQAICYHMDVQTFAVALLTCKAFWSAGQSKPVLLRHLGAIPGWRKDLKDLTTHELFSLFRLRASADMHSAGVFADITIHKLIGGPSLAKAVISRNHGDYLVTVGRSGMILVYHLFQDGVELESRLKPKDSCFDLDHHELINIAFSTSGDIAALYKPGTIKPASSYLSLFIFQRKLTGLRRGDTRTWYQERRDLEYIWDSQPTGLSVAADGTTCIAWTNPAWKGSTMFMLYLRDGHRTYGFDSGPSPPFSTYSFSETDDVPNPSKTAFEPRFIDADKFLTFHDPNEPVHPWSSPQVGSYGPGAGYLRENSVPIDIEKQGRPRRFVIDMPFHGLHTKGHRRSDDSELSCQESYLAVGVGYLCGKNHAFIVRSNRYTSTERCHHTQIDLAEGRWLSDWQAVALLAGWRQGSSSLGTVMAISSQGRRIAVADWSRLLVWSFDPGMLRLKEREYYFPVRDYNARRKIGQIRPTQLRCPAIVYKLSW
ncbi:MAG: hypothetical protein Q9211_002434 [Gyalolechia sp. 1 TL-2023]